MTQLYLVPLPDADAQRTDKAVASAIQQAGLLEGNGVAVENVATDSVDATVEGQIRFGKTLSRKVGEEIDSLSESSYTTLPLFSETGAIDERTRGYYEIEDADVSPAKPGVEHVFQYTVGLSVAGTREDSRRAVRTNPTAVDSVYPDASTAALIAIPNTATEVRWYDDASGTEAATATETAESEYGTIARYDPADASFTDPTLTYDLAFGDDGPTDVRVYDSRDRVKFAATASGQQVNTWIHAYHTGYQFDGAAVIDTGRFRLVLGGNINDAVDAEARTVASGDTFTVQNGETVIDSSLTVEDGGTFTVQSTGLHILTDDLRNDFGAAEWNDTDQRWEPISVTGPAWSLTSWSLTGIRPARVTIQTRWSDGTNEYVLNATAERGADRLVWEVPENATDPAQGLIDLLEPTARDTDETAHATQGLINRDKLAE